ncbi:hypothetical protein [endosymbiont 'TC1' of Trimyema compressum]|uniref:hypothetical protein n=1 Tax=endosymbiont 'TC1' of Trimyema compressum TaxID=243899 RepID=UPI0013922CAC|nr:hypothetical protein [endosymbiont 'TC1' of Trimyema compressum]
MERIFQLVSMFFKHKEWFSIYLQKVNQYTPFVTLENYFGLMNLLEDSLIEKGELDEVYRPFTTESI